MSKNPDTSTEKKKKKKYREGNTAYARTRQVATRTNGGATGDDDFGLPAASRAPGVNFTIG